MEEEQIKKKILELLKEIYDPEIMINIVDLGLISELKINNEKKEIYLKILFTTPLCPLAPLILSQVEEKIKSSFSNYNVNIEYDTETIWTPDKMNPEIRNQFGF